MFDVSFFELTIIFIISLIVLGPTRLLQAAKFMGAFIGKLQNTWQGVQTEIERELQLEALKKSTESSFDMAKHSLNQLNGETQQLSQEAQDELAELADIIEAKRQQTTQVNNAAHTDSNNTESDNTESHIEKTNEDK